MSLALVTISAENFDLIFDHLTAHNPRCRNMHMRSARQPKTGRVLRYLHAMLALHGSVKQIEGMISGPKVFAHYKIARRANQPAQMTVIVASGDPKELKRLGKRFVIEVLNRVDEERERTGIQFPPNYLSGQYYLRRRLGGMSATHPTCQQAIASGTLDQRFVAQLGPWNVELLCPP